MAQLKSGTTIGGRNVMQEFDSHKNDKVSHIDYAWASGTNTYAANIQGITSLTEGLSIKIKFINANTGASTLNINGLGAKEIRKSNGNTLSSGNIKAGQICHLVYTGSVFQLLGEGGEYGTAQPQHVLQGYTIGTEQGIVAGTMSNYGNKTFTPSDSTQTSGAGYYNSITVNPRPTLSGNASTSHVLSGYTFYSNNYTKQTGTMPNQGAKIITPSTVNQAIPAGYHNGQGYVKGDANLTPENIKKGVSIFGRVGTYEPIAYEGSSGGIPVAFQDSYDKNYFNFPRWQGDIPAGTTRIMTFTVFQDLSHLTYSNGYLNLTCERRRIENLYQASTLISLLNLDAGKYLFKDRYLLFSYDETTGSEYLKLDSNSSYIRPSHFIPGCRYAFTIQGLSDPNDEGIIYRAGLYFYGTFYLYLDRNLFRLV